MRVFPPQKVKTKQEIIKGRGGEIEGGGGVGDKKVEQEEGEKDQVGGVRGKGSSGRGKGERIKWEG